jgi:hypothetical protein
VQFVPAIDHDTIQYYQAMVRGELDDKNQNSLEICPLLGIRLGERGDAAVGIRTLDA